MRQHQKQPHKSGFTLIEVLLFLAVSTLIIVGLMTGITTTVARQRYNDSVQDLVQHLRKAYADVITTSNARDTTDQSCTAYDDVRGKLINARDTIFAGGDNPFSGPDALKLPSKAINSDGDGRGRSDCVIYGKLIVFGKGNPATPAVPGSGNEIITYDVIGTDMTDDLRKQNNLTDYNSLIVTVPAMLDGACGMGDAGFVDRYSLGWGATVDQPKQEHQTLQAAVLIVRSPITGTVHTLITPNNDGNFINRIGNSVSSDSGPGSCIFHGDSYSLWEMIGRRKLSLSTKLEMCISSEDTYAQNGQRRMISIKADGRNGTAVELLPTDNQEANLCN
jgi:type II secretory pathway pseudopilin PulG